MNPEAREYKCPACGAGLAFDPTTGDMGCAYCDSHFTLQQLAELSAAEEESAATANEIQWDTYEKTEETGDYSALICPSCGAEIVADSTTAASECVYCGNPAIIRQRLTGMFRPDWVLPFKTTKQQAVNALKKLYQGKKLLPDAFTEGNRVEKVAGMYVPYWMYDCQSNAYMTYDATKVSFFSDAQYNYTRTDKYVVARGGTAQFNGIPVDGSTKLDNKYTEAIEPYDYSDLVEFRDMYLSGYLADKYDVDSAECNPRADERVRVTMTEELQKTVQGYSSVTLRDARVNNTNGKIHYALMPVWMLNTRFEGQTYTFAMNGQTGKMIGDLPVDKKKARKMFFKWAGILSAATSALAILAMLLR